MGKIVLTVLIGSAIIWVVSANVIAITGTYALAKRFIFGKSSDERDPQ